MTASTCAATCLYILISSGLRSAITASSGFNAKNIAPPPRNGSIYLPYESGTFGSSSPNIWVLPPAHFRIGFACILSFFSIICSIILFPFIMARYRLIQRSSIMSLILRMKAVLIPHRFHSGL